MGPATIFSLAEAPIENLTLSNISWTMHKGARGGYSCTGWNGTKQVTGLFATGQAVGVTPPLSCAFLGPPGDAAATAGAVKPGPPNQGLKTDDAPPCSLNGAGSPCVCDKGCEAQTSRIFSLETIRKNVIPMDLRIFY